MTPFCKQILINYLSKFKVMLLVYIQLYDAEQPVANCQN